MSNLKYKSKIEVPAVVMPNEIELTSPSEKRIAANGIWGTSENHTRDKDLLSFGNFIKCKISLAEDTEKDGDTIETLERTFSGTNKEVSYSSENDYYYVDTRLVLGNQEVMIKSLKWYDASGAIIPDVKDPFAIISNFGSVYLCSRSKNFNRSIPSTADFTITLKNSAN